MPATKNDANTFSGSDSSDNDGQARGGRRAGPLAQVGAGSNGGNQSQSAKSNASDDLKSREYKDANGETHHHTRTYMEQHKGE